MKSYHHRIVTVARELKKLPPRGTLGWVDRIVNNGATEVAWVIFKYESWTGSNRISVCLTAEEFKRHIAKARDYGESASYPFS